MTNISLLNLPIEILHNIFDYLDIKTISQSLRCVCNQLYKVIATYNRFKLDFTSSTNFNFELIFERIPPEDVISLTFSVGTEKQFDSIHLFLSLNGIQRLTRLRSLTLLDVNSVHLDQLLQHINIQSLVSVSIRLQEENHAVLLPLLSTVISQPHFRKLCLTGYRGITNTLTWPINCTLRCLTIQECTFEEYNIILQKCSLLKVLELQNCTMYNYNETSFSSSIHTFYPQVTSLTMTNCHIAFKNLYFLLSLTPSLIHLKLLVKYSWDFENFCNGSFWEEFIKQKLPGLCNFNFFFCKSLQYNSTIHNLHSIINRYQTPFWLQYKQWYVTCDCVISSSSSQVMVYTIPEHIGDMRYLIRCQATVTENICFITEPMSNKTDQVNNTDVRMKHSLIILCD